MTQHVTRNTRYTTLKNLYYGWWIVITLAITETISWGVVYYAYSVIITALEGEFGWTRAQVTGAFSLAFLIAGGMAVPVGFWLDRKSPRGLMTVGSIAASALMVALSQVQNLTQLYLVWIGLGITAATILYEPAFVVVAKWFARRRSTALMVITLAAGFASTIFLPLTAWLVRLYGWRQAMLWLAALLAVTTIPLHALILRKSPAALGLSMDGESARPATAQPTHRPATDMTVGMVLRQPVFWWLAAALSVGSMAAIGIRVHFIPFLEDQGYQPEYAAWIAGLIGAMQVLGRVLYAPAGGRFAPTLMVALIFALQAVALVILLVTPGVAGVWIFVVLFGAVYGATTLARPAMLADQFGAAHYGRISSVQYVFQTLATTSAPYGVALIYTAFDNSYRPALSLLIVLSLLAAGAVVIVRRWIKPVVQVLAD
ncbi:MAG: MFS transporter [Caldilineaceae bacterium]